MTTINLNEHVWVELTENGWQSLIDYYEKLFAGSDTFAKNAYSISEFVDSYKRQTAPHTIDGVERMLTRFQLHDLMLKLGDKMFPGAKNVVENNNLYFDLER